MKKLSIIIVIISVSLLCVVGAIPRETILETLPVFENQKSEKCSSEMNSFKLCAVSDEVSVKTGEKTAFTILVTNAGSEDITISNKSPIEINVYDEKGKKIPTILEAKAGEEKLTADDFKKIISQAFISHRYEIILKPKQSWKRIVKISDDYDLSRKGKYFVEIKVKLPNKQQTGFFELILDKVELSVS
ncbi:MAG: hypothetical protein ACR2IA_11195 [Pyrinomonadaceae bacterium]